MRSWNNLKDAGGMLPAWFVPFILSGAIIGLYVIARYTTTDRPHELIALASLVAIVLSLAVGFGILVSAILKAQTGNVMAAVSDGFQRGLTYAWVTSGVSLFAYVGASPAYSLVTDNLYYTVTIVTVACLLGIGLWASGLRPKTEPTIDATTGLPTTAVSLPSNFTASNEQRAAFQVTMADQSRLLIHQAARIIAYKGSNCLIADSFSAFLDMNARTAKIFTDMNLLSTSEMIYWRMHMLMIGTAAEQQIRETVSDAAVDDMQNFEDLAIKYLHLTGKGNFFKPVTEGEAILKSNRILLLRKTILHRCSVAIATNRHLVLELIKLMRGRPTLVYDDLKYILDRVSMPADFPKAEFDTNEAMERTLMQLTHEGPEPLDGESEYVSGDVSDGHFTETRADNVHEFPHASMKA